MLNPHHLPNESECVHQSEQGGGPLHRHLAGEHLNVYGSRSSIAKHLGSAPTQQREAEVIAALERGLQGALAAWIPEPPGPLPPGGTPGPGVHSELMRWGAAFPQQPGLPQALALCRHSLGPAPAPRP